MTLHLYRAPSQPATRYRVQLDEHTLWCRNAPGRQIHADCCRKRRVARNLTVQVYYDCHRFSCRPGMGCKARKARR